MYADQRVVQSSKLTEPTVTSCVEDFDPVIERAKQYAGRFQRLLEKVRGELPPEKSTVTDSLGGPSHSILAAINQRRSHLVEALDHMERTLNGLESSL